jgi:hypothetical protein
MQTLLGISARNLGPALGLASLTAAGTHGEFHRTKIAVAVGIVAGVLLPTIGALLRSSPGLVRLSKVMIRAGIILLLAVPALFMTSSVAASIGIWRAKRYVESVLVRQLEAHRKQSGTYPEQLRLWPAPEGAPWLIDRSTYFSRGNVYAITVSDPGVCGRFSTYGSGTHTWVESHSPCWF